MLKTIYAFFLGILLAIFIGVGIAAFYAAPTEPKAPDIMVGKDGPTQAQQDEQKAYDQAFDSYKKNQQEPYDRNVSIAALAGAVILVAIGLLLENRISVLADGALLGGVFTLLYSIGRGFAANNSKYSFVSVAVGLVVALGLGYQRFIRTPHHVAKND